MVHSSCAETPIGRLGIKGSARPGEDVLVGFRPEALTVVEGQTATDTNVLQATLRTSTFLGDQFIYYVEVATNRWSGRTAFRYKKTASFTSTSIRPMSWFFRLDKKPALTFWNKALIQDES